MSAGEREGSVSDHLHRITEVKQSYWRAFFTQLQRLRTEEICVRPMLVIHSDISRRRPQCPGDRRSNPDRVRKKCITPLIQRPHKIRLNMDCLTFAIQPFSSVSIERKMSNVIIAGLLPMLDRQ